MKANNNKIAFVNEEDEEKKLTTTSSSSSSSSSSNNEKKIHTPRINFASDTSPVQDSFRSTQVLSSNIRSGGQIKYTGHGLEPAPFASSSKSMGYNNNNSHETVYNLPIPAFGKLGNTSSSKEVEMIDVCNQDMEECGMDSCKVFVPCATLEALDDDIELIVPGLIREEKEIENELNNGLTLNATNCLVANGLKESLQLVPLSLARVSDDIDLKLLYENINSNAPQIEGCVIIEHKPVTFAIHFYECPNNKNETIIEFQRRCGDTFVFQKFYNTCLEQLTKSMKNLQDHNCSCTSNDWGCLPSLDDFMTDESNACLWDTSCLDLLATLIEDESLEAVDMLGGLCGQMEKQVSLRTQFLQNKMLMKQIVTKTLTHQDQCLVGLGLIVLDISLGEQKVEVVKDILRSYSLLAFIIGLLDCESMIVLRRAVRLLYTLTLQCDCSWKLNESQKQILNERIPRIQYILLESQTWSCTYATESFVTKYMLQRIVQHPKV